MNTLSFSSSPLQNPNLHHYFTFKPHSRNILPFYFPTSFQNLNQRAHHFRFNHNLPRSSFSVGESPSQVSDTEEDDEEEAAEEYEVDAEFDQLEAESEDEIESDVLESEGNKSRFEEFKWQRIERIRNDVREYGDGILDVHELSSVYNFRIDKFQRLAIQAFLRGSSVVVSAPTSAGKTLIAEAAAVATVARGKRIFYTTPLKALSNQKFREFCDAFGEDNVGLLTGDSAVNRDAPVLIMTTEILRNMLYQSVGIMSSESGLFNVDVIVLDEAHYLSDISRGTVWEEIVIYCPKEVQLICLSATVANPDELSGWINQNQTKAFAVPRRSLMTLILSSCIFSQINKNVAFAQQSVEFREFIDTFDGYSFNYPKNWIQVKGANADIFFRDPFVLDENLSVEVSSPSSSTYKSVEDLGPPEEAGKAVLRQYLTEFMSTRLGVRRESSVLSTSSRVADDGKMYYQIEVNIKSYASNNELAVMPQDRVVRLEWDRRYLSVLGVENNQLYELRLQVPENVFVEEENDLRRVMDSFRVNKLSA